MFISEPKLAENLGQSIASADLVSFDVFDTLLRRRFLRPSDLFAYMEEQHRLPDFRFERVEAERKARLDRPDRADVTYADIYQHLHVDPELELQTERAMLYPRPEIVDIHRRAREAGKKIAILSDMYLPKAFIADVLSRIGVDYDYLFVSGDDAVAKHDGSMFRELLRVSKLKARQVLHFGDNERSDYKKPKSLGIRAVLVSNEWPCSDHRRFGPSLNDRLAKGSWRGSQLAARIRDFRQVRSPEDAWTEIGSLVSGPLALGYASWVSAQADKDGVRHIAFLARDGWLPKTALEKTRPDLNVSYRYVNRAIVGRALFDNPSPTLLSQIEPVLPASTRDVLSQYGFDAEAIATEAGDIVDLGAIANKKALFARLTRLRDASATFRNEVVEAKRLLRMHLAEAGAFSEPDSFALSDIGWTGNVSDMLATLFPEAKRWRFYFFGTRENFRNRALNFRSFFFHLGIPHHHSELAFECVEIPEALLSSAECSSVKLALADGVVAPVPIKSETRMSKVAESRRKIVAGAEAFIDFACQRPEAVAVWTDRHVVFGLLEHVSRSQDEEILRAFDGFRHQVHAGDAEWRIIGSECADYASTLVRWIRGRKMRRIGAVAWIEGQERAYIDSLKGVKKAIARQAYRIARSKRKRLRSAS